MDTKNKCTYQRNKMVRNLRGF